MSKNTKEESFREYEKLLEICSSYKFLNCTGDIKTNKKNMEYYEIYN